MTRTGSKSFLSRPFGTLVPALAAAAFLLTSAPALAQAEQAEPIESAPRASASARVLVYESVIDGTEEQELRWPSAVAAGGAGELAVADSWTPRVLVFREAGGAEGGWRFQRGVGLPGTPTALAWDGGRFVASLRGGQGLVAIEGAELLLRKLALPAGAVPGPLAPVPGGGLLVHDRGRGRVLRLGARGDVISEAPVDGHVTALAAGPGGGFYTALGDEGVVRRHDAGGAVEEVWELPGEGPVPAWPAGLAVEPGGDVLVLDRHTERVIALDPTGGLQGFGARGGWEPGLLLFPAGITLLPDGRVAVADQGNGRAQVFLRVEEREGP